ncbi:hypothetical protein M441DRAFT_137837 [Trichoderma asperellum CBS 433.97]|uniref:Uncharacterized protein n=1 Tax=Trichoderma asperellum (strain ATCC 204424 / CBS 433.97 / NBRC 101777) TaxID=1042311 RepID=A0A2T3ZCL4_TRIA4|nr:hypothetical protein M441DRAFT_137837 [Trichoderma asperellum CBS 433.97]PTB42548.1 hypothetical protein M441DRAFT_137837 [Trichoderma asperellum CBS 433.97]
MATKTPWMVYPPGLNGEGSENIRLGAIITDPFNPSQILTTADNSILDAFYPPVEENTQLNHHLLWIADKDTPSFLRRCWESFSSGMSVISVNSEMFTRYQLDAEVLVTKEFNSDPRLTEIMARLANPTVDQFMDERIRALLGLWSRENPVYMITGLRYAKGRIAFREAEIKTTEFRFRHNIASPIIWTDRDPSYSSEKVFTTEEDRLIAYKLLKIEKSHNRKDGSDDELILSEVVVEGSEWC